MNATQRNALLDLQTAKQRYNFCICHASDLVRIAERMRTDAAFLDQLAVSFQQEAARLSAVVGNRANEVAQLCDPVVESVGAPT